MQKGYMLLAVFKNNPTEESLFVLNGQPMFGNDLKTFQEMATRLRLKFDFKKNGIKSMKLIEVSVRKDLETVYEDEN